MRPVLSNVACTDSLPIKRFRTTLLGSLLGIARISRISVAICSGGSTLTHGPSLALGHNHKRQLISCFACPPLCRDLDPPLLVHAMVVSRIVIGLLCCLVRIHSALFTGIVNWANFP